MAMKKLYSNKNEWTKTKHQHDWTSQIWVKNYIGEHMYSNVSFM